MTDTDVDDLIRAHLHVAKAITRERVMQCPPVVRYEDLIGAGMMGLFLAARNWDPDRGVPFSNYAAIRIKGHLLDELRAQDWVGRHARTDANRAGTGTAWRLVPLDEWAANADLAGYVSDPERIHVDRDEITRLYAAISRLPTRQRLVIELCCLHRGVEQKTLADQWGVTQSRISQIRAEAIRKLAKDPDLIEVPV